MNATRQHSTPVILLLLFVALATYTLPWLVNPGAGLSLGADDLAEWTSIHPQVRTASPPLLTTLLLRVPLVCLACCVTFSISPKIQYSLSWWLTVLTVAVIFLFCLPPLEFLTSARGDINYQQQFILAVLLLAISGTGLMGIGRSVRSGVVILAAVLGIICSIWGLEGANQLMLDLVLPAQRGMGAVLMSGVFFVFLLLKIKDSHYSAALFR